MQFLKNQWRLIALAALGVAVLVNIFTTNRPVAFYRMVQITQIGSVPDAPELADLRENVQYGSGFMPHMGLVCCRARDVRAQPIRIGWVYEEHGFLGMPYSANNISVGPTLYVDNGEGYRLSGISSDQIARLEQAVGRPLVGDYQFRWYLQVWGMLFPPLLAFLAWLFFSDRRRREEASWEEEAQAV